MRSSKFEFLALKWVVCEKCQDYLYYSKVFTVFFDNDPLSYILNTAKLNATGMRWVTEQANFSFEIKDRPRSECINCNYLSRNSSDIEQYIKNKHTDYCSINQHC